MCDRVSVTICECVGAWARCDVALGGKLGLVKLRGAGHTCGTIWQQACSKASDLGAEAEAAQGQATPVAAADAAGASGARDSLPMTNQSCVIVWRLQLSAA